MRQQVASTKAGGCAGDAACQVHLTRAHACGVCRAGSLATKHMIAAGIRSAASCDATAAVASADADGSGGVGDALAQAVEARLLAAAGAHGAHAVGRACVQRERLERVVLDCALAWRRLRVGWANR